MVVRNTTITICAFWAAISQTSYMLVVTTRKVIVCAQFCDFPVTLERASHTHPAPTTGKLDWTKALNKQVWPQEVCTV